MASKNLANMSSAEFKLFLSSFDYVLSDIDGVYWHYVPLPKAGAFINSLKEIGKRVYYVTNNSILTFEEQQKRFKAVNLEIKEDDIINPSKTIVEYLKSINFKKKIYAVSCPQTVNVLRRNGFECEEGPQDISNLNPFTVTGGYGQFILDDKEIGAVVFDGDYWANSLKLHKSEVYLRRPDVLFLEGCTDKVLPGPGKITLIGPGHFTELVAKSTNRKPIVLAKPGSKLLEVVKKSLNIEDPSRVLFIGDMIDQDIAFGKVGGFQTLLVMTTQTLEDAIEKDVIPNYHVSTLGDALHQFEL